MNAALFSEFRRCVDRGERQQSACLVSEFIASFEDETQRRAWVRGYLEGGEYGHKIRHELYRDLIFPELYLGYRADEPWSLYFLAHTIQNVYDVRSLHERLDGESDYSLLLRCYEVSPDFRDVRTQLLDRVCRSLNFAIHEWPSGLCCEIEDTESDLALGRRLDTEDKFSIMFGEVELVLAEAKTRANRVGGGF